MLSSKFVLGYQDFSDDLHTGLDAELEGCFNELVLEDADCSQEGTPVGRLEALELALYGAAHEMLLAQEHLPKSSRLWYELELARLAALRVLENE